MRPSFLFTVLAGLLAVGLTSLAGCQKTCPANMSPPPVFMLAFSADTLTGTSVGFRRAEVRSAYLVRYATGDFQQPTDTLRQPTSATSPKSGFFVYYGGGQPPEFAVPDDGSRRGAVSFRLVVPAANRNYNISNVLLETAPGKNCDPYRVTHREATVNGQRRDGVDNLPQLTK